MAKAKTQATLSPEQLDVGQVILTADVQTVLGAVGFAVGDVVQTHIAGHGYTDTPSNEPSLLAGAGNVIRSTSVWIPPHCDELDVVVEIELGSGSTATAEVSVTIGSAGALTFSRAGVAASQPAAQQVATSSTGTGWQLVEVEGEVTSGTDAAAALGEWRVAGLTIAAASLPDPTVE